MAGSLGVELHLSMEHDIFSSYRKIAIPSCLRLGLFSMPVGFDEDWQYALLARHGARCTGHDARRQMAESSEAERTVAAWYFCRPPCQHPATASCVMHFRSPHAQHALAVCTSRTCACRFDDDRCSTKGKALPACCRTGLTAHGRLMTISLPNALV